jgi:ATP-binding cassette subfamily A (ABC1) protein 3
MKRQFIQKRRMPCSCCLEIFLPILFILGIVGAARASTITENPAVNYIVEGKPLVDVVGNSLNLICYNASGATPADVRLRLRSCNFGQPNVTLLCDDPFASLYNVPVPGLCVPRNFAFTVGGLMRDWQEERLLPKFDDFVIMQWGFRIAAAKTLTFGRFANPNINKALFNSGKLFWVGDTAQTRSIINFMNTTYAMYRYVHEPTLWNDYNQLIGYLRSVDGEGKAWGVINVQELTPTSFTVALGWNKSSIIWTNNIRARFAGGLGQQPYGYYVASGFVTFQQALTQYWSTSTVGVSPAEFNNPMSAAPMPTSAYKNSAFLTLAGQLSPLVLVLSFLYSVSQLTKRLVEEKENKLREGMFIMGLGKFSFYGGWILTYALQALITCIVVAIMLKRAILKGSDPFLIFLVYYLFALSSITLAALFSTFFSKSRVSGIVAPLLYFALAIPSFALPPGSSSAALTGISIFSPSAFAGATSLLFTYEVGNGMGWKDTASALDAPNMATCLAFLAGDCILYLLLTLYFDAVLPSEWGTKKHPLFFLPCFWAKKTTAANAAPKDSPNFTDLKNHKNSPLTDMVDGPVKQHLLQANTIEEYPEPSENCTIHINNIRKEFAAGDKVKVAVDNFQLRLFPNHITALLGHNGAGKSTTMNMLTGMLSMSSGDCTIYGASVSAELEKARAEIGFCPQHNVLWPNLTCLEHLEYFAALKGVPSSERREQALAFLNHVDLADKKDAYSSSLSGGQKRKLSVAIAFIGGSRLVLLDEPTAGMDVAARRHTWELLKQMSAGRTIVLTTHYMDEADLLGYRVAIMSKGRLHSYGSPMFLKSRLGTGYTLRISAEKAIENPAPITAMVKFHVPQAELKECKGQEVAYHLPITAAISFPVVLNDIEVRGKMLAGIVGCSMSVSTLEDVFLKIAADEEVEQEQEDLRRGDGTVALSSMHVDAMKVENALQTCFGPNAPSRADCKPSFTRQVGALLHKRLANSRRDRRTICIQIFTPLLCITLAMCLALAGPPGTPEITFDVGLYAPEPQMISTDYCGTKNSYFNPAFTKDIANPDLNLLNFSSLLLATAKTHGRLERFVSVACDVPNNVTGIPTTTYFTNASALHSLPQAVNEYYQATIRNARTDATIRSTIKFNPIPWTIREQGTVDSFVTLIVGFFIMIPFTFIPSTFVSFIVKERECKAKHQQIVSGVGLGAYWVSNYLFDLLSFFVTELLAIIIFLCFQRDEYIGSAENVGCVIALFTMYGLSSIASSYAFSFAFDSHGTAQNIIMLLNFIFGFALVITAYIFKIIEDTKAAAEVLVFFFRLIPSYCLGEGILVLAQAPLQKQLGVTVKLFDMDNTGWALTYMGINFLLFVGITAFLDHPARAKRAQQLLHNKDAIPPPIEHEDVDVAKERAIVESGSRPGDVVVVKHLRKEYGKKVAVKNLSFGVIQGEVFGFLGTNGAGKTTTMSILTGEHMPTNGCASVAGHDVVEEAIASRSVIGYCPQFDSILDLLTVQDHIQLYAAIRGIPAAREKEVVDALITACGLEQYRHVKSKSLSGGNKRRLSVAIALMGSPSVIILDEPSAGMDPVARRELWEVIIAVAKHSSVILTTHHLEEIDVLAHRVGIMVEGELKCLGSLDQLKRKFGTGFELSVRVRSGNSELEQQQNVSQTKIFIQGQFPRAQIAEERQGKLTYNMPHLNSSLARVFQTMISCKELNSAPIEDFTVQQTSLEQVFLRISEAATANEDDSNALSPTTRNEMDNQEPRASNANHLSFLQDSAPITSPLPPQNRTRASAPSAPSSDLSAPLVSHIEPEYEERPLKLRSNDPLDRSL